MLSFVLQVAAIIVCYAIGNSWYEKMDVFDDRRCPVAYWTGFLAAEASLLVYELFH